MKKYLFAFLILIFSAAVWANQPKYNKDKKLSYSQFFEREYRAQWDKLSEIEKFGIACTSNIFERNNQFHLDFSNVTGFDEYTPTGIEILDKNWNIHNRDELLKNYVELEAGEQASEYNKLKGLLEKYPDLTVIEIAAKELLSVTEASRMYFVQEMKDKLGAHGIEAWVDARKISILRWGIGAGFIDKAEVLYLIEPIVNRIKDDYSGWEDFIAHYVAGYCYNAVYESTCPDCAKKILAAVESSRAYIPFEELNFTGLNADKEHVLTTDAAVYTPSAVASRMIPIQKLYRKDYSQAVLLDLIKEEERYPEISDMVFIWRLIMMCSYSSVQERVNYIETKLDYIDSLDKESSEYKNVNQIYMLGLIKLYEPAKAIELYESQSDSFKANVDLFYNYGYSYYLLANLSSTILERDIYISRAQNVFKRLKSHGYDLGTFIECWLKAVEAL